MPDVKARLIRFAWVRVADRLLSPHPQGLRRVVGDWPFLEMREGLMKRRVWTQHLKVRMMVHDKFATEPPAPVDRLMHGGFIGRTRYELRIGVPTSIADTAQAGAALLEGHRSELEALLVGFPSHSLHVGGDPWRPTLAITVVVDDHPAESANTLLEVIGQMEQCAATLSE